jgi:WD40 repeat protein
VVHSGPGTSDSADEAADRSPYRGLGFYTEADARWFFGRESERKIILAHLRTAPLTVLYAESGVGKSSLLRAGVAARLRELAVRSIDASHTPTFAPVVFSAWKDEPVADLISEIERQAGLLRPADNGGSRAAAASGRGLGAAITAAASTLNATLTIILDQFEEHFSYRPGRQQDRFADELAECVNSDDIAANFLIAIREDAYGGLGDLFSGRIGNVYDNYLHLEYLTREAARDAIEKPIDIYNGQHRSDEAVTLEDELVDAVLDEVRRGKLEPAAWRLDRDGADGQPTSGADEIETPFLQLVMTRVWEWERAHHSRVLRRATLDHELGGAEAIVRNHVGRALTGLDRPELETATDIFRELVTPSGAKIAHTAPDLANMTGHPEERVAAVVRRLYHERILRAVDPAPGATETRYELFHDRLAAPILDWRSHRENIRLERAKEQAELEAQTQREQARRFKRRAHIMLALAISLLVLLVAVVALLEYARTQNTSANRAKHAAQRESAQATYFGLTTRAQSQLAARPDISLLLYLAAYGESPQPIAARNLLATLQVLKRSGATGVLHGHTDTVRTIAFDATGTTLASAGGDNTIRLWTVTSGAHYPLGRPLRAGGPLFSVAFEPNSHILASGGFNRVILWSLARHAEQRVIRYKSGAITSVAFSRQGLLAAAGSDGTVLLWNPATHTSRSLRVSSELPVRAVAFSPDGAVLATSSGNSVVLWNAGTARRIGAPLTGRTGTVNTVAFSPDGHTIAAGGSAGTIYRWHADTHLPETPTLTGLMLVKSIAFSPDGRSLAAGGGGTVTHWDLTGGNRVGQQLAGHSGPVPSVAFSPDGKVLAAAGADQTIFLWTYPIRAQFGIPLINHPNGARVIAVRPDGLVIASGGPDGQVYISDRRTGRLLRTLPGGAGQITDLAFAGGGHVLAAAYVDGAVRLWDPDRGNQLGAPLRGHAGPVYSVVFDRTGRRLASGGADGTVRLWSARTHAELGQPLRGGYGAIYAVAFSPDATKIAAAGDGRAISLWSARTRTPLTRGLIPQGEAVFTLAFSPDGHLLASGGADDTIRLWSIGASGYVPLRKLTGHTSFIRSLAFSPDGNTLASGSSDATVRLWDVATGAPLGSPLGGPLLPPGYQFPVYRVAFTPDGRFVASSDLRDIVRLWQGVGQPSSPSALRDQVCAFLAAGLSRAEWAHYAPNIPYRQTCPRTTPS